MATEAVKITYVEGAAPSTPAASRTVVYAKADGLMYSKDDAGVETLMSGGAGGGAVATDVIWDAKGDLAGGTGANTAVKLTVGTNGYALVAASGETTGLKWQAVPGAIAAKVYTTGVSITNAVITFASEVYDTAAFHDTGSNTSRLTIPITGYYHFEWSGFASRADARIELFKNGANVRGGNVAGASAGNYINGSGDFDAVATDYFELSANTVAATTFGDNGDIGDNFTFSARLVGI